MTNNTNSQTMGGASVNRITQDLISAWHLFWDPRVPTALKILLPVAALVYWVSPIDIMPGLPFDDIAVLILALRMFVMMAPSSAKSGGPSAPGKGADNTAGADDIGGDGPVIDTTWRVIDE